MNGLFSFIIMKTLSYQNQEFMEVTFLDFWSNSSQQITTNTRLPQQRQPLSIRKMSPVFLQPTWKKRGCSNALRITRPLYLIALCPGVTIKFHLYAHIQESTVIIEIIMNSSTSSMLTHRQSRKRNVAPHAPELPTRQNSTSKSTPMKKTGMIR